ncbi:Membrane protein insertase YidC [bioreactor metagenome]|uniref:Membrane protein insertase YidC n=1 Tax=bioreactor metagenome TaxID=1076179 RepID=A0A645DHD4_9ZZZZ|nr:YidC/Oxa1 family membrane protein insertase [Candidatus Pelethousia sp.]
MQHDFFLTTWFLEAMKWVYGKVDSVFLTILICTLVLKMITLFSDIKTRKSSADMAAVQPEIQKLQKKYPNDPQKLQQAQSKLMKERGVSMWGSCLPMLITMPLFFCFLAAFRFWGYEETIRLLVDDNPVQLLESFKFLWIHNIWQPDSGLAPVIMKAKDFLSIAKLDQLLYLQNNPQVWQKLVDMGIAAANGLNENGVMTYVFLNTDAAQAAYTAAVQPLANIYTGLSNGWFIMPILAGASNFLSSWLMQRGQPQNPQMGGTNKMMMWMFPIMSVWICLTYNASFAVYWTISSICMIITNLVLNKKYPKGASAAEGEKK